MIRKYIALCIVFTFFEMSDAAARSISCIYINGEQKCAQQEDPYGDTAAAAAGINNGQGLAGAGAGTRGNFPTDFQQIGDENSGYQPAPGQGNNGGMGVAVGTGPGFPYDRNFPVFNGDPFQFVRDFFQGFQNTG